MGVVIFTFKQPSITDGKSIWHDSDRKYVQMIVHPKMKTHSISTHPYADVKMCEDPSSQNTPGVSA